MAEEEGLMDTTSIDETTTWLKENGLSDIVSKCEEEELTKELFIEADATQLQELCSAYDIGIKYQLKLKSVLKKIASSAIAQSKPKIIYLTTKEKEYITNLDGALKEIFEEIIENEKNEKNLNEQKKREIALVNSSMDEIIEIIELKRKNMINEINEMTLKRQEQINEHKKICNKLKQSFLCKLTEIDEITTNDTESNKCILIKQIVDDSMNEYETLKKKKPIIDNMKITVNVNQINASIAEFCYVSTINDYNPCYSVQPTDNNKNVGNNINKNDFNFSVGNNMNYTSKAFSFNTPHLEKVNASNDDSKDEDEEKHNTAPNKTGGYNTNTNGFNFSFGNMLQSNNNNNDRPFSFNTPYLEKVNASNDDSKQEQSQEPQPSEHEEKPEKAVEAQTNNITETASTDEIDEISDEIDAVSEELVFQHRPIKACRWDKEHEKWRGRGKGKMTIYYNKQKGLGKIVFVDEKHERTRLLQYIDGQQHCKYMIYDNNESNNGKTKVYKEEIVWEGADYTMDVINPMIGRWKVQFVGNENAADEFMETFNQYIDNRKCVSFGSNLNDENILINNSDYVGWDQFDNEIKNVQKIIKDRLNKR